jgi:hypothetical protein
VVLSLTATSAAVAAGRVLLLGQPHDPSQRIHSTKSTHIGLDCSRRFPSLGPGPVLTLRGGGVNKKALKSNASSKATTTKRKKKKKSGQEATLATESSEASAHKVKQVLQETPDAAQALGDAIRSRAEQVIQSSSNEPRNVLLSQIDVSMASIGSALGTTAAAATVLQENDTGGVPADTSAVIAHYFLKSHGGVTGTYAFQCVCSLLASSAGLLALLTSSRDSNLSMLFTARCLWYGLLKHVVGVINAMMVAAQAIPILGLYQTTQQYLVPLQYHPISHYVFYTACTYSWIRLTQHKSTTPKFILSPLFVTAVLVGPVVLREIVSTLFMIHDVLVLWVFTATTSSPESDDNIVPSGGVSAAKIVLSATQGLVDAVMSVLVTPEVWRQKADPAQRQAILAKLVSRISLVLEVITGVLLSVDVLRQIVTLFFGVPGTVMNRATMINLLQRVLLARLYIHFLYIRKSKIAQVATQIRGGAAQVPFYVLDVLIQPGKAMGISSKSGSLSNPNTNFASRSLFSQRQPNEQAKLASSTSSKHGTATSDGTNESQALHNGSTWRDWIAEFFGLDE